MRLLFWVMVFFFIFYLGMQSATINQDEARPTIQTEQDIRQSSASTENFDDKHDEVINHQTQSDTSGFYSIAVFLENFVKTFFSVIFNFLYRFSSMFF
ncbi:hypothetical protein E3U55_00260 [Filobacillus milosensis]|uniref:Uncharacterized protein n=1 Tax=Filobacillus milosensis TaxID=94137 RepID=A0A4Y8IUJ1_9BACI|nr:hypothetical protein [Filobacillus milosensis]TFB24859.1 hypothetical protein E3U55_00260 [Filobacillus milosensis]